YNHDAPTSSRPRPKPKPIHAALRALGAFCHSANRSASVTTGTPENANGAKANTVAAPSTIAAMNSVGDGAWFSPALRGVRPGARLGASSLTHPRQAARRWRRVVGPAVRLAACTAGGCPHE